MLRRWLHWKVWWNMLLTIYLTCCNIQRSLDLPWRMNARRNVVTARGSTTLIRTISYILPLPASVEMLEKKCLDAFQPIDTTWHNHASWQGGNPPRRYETCKTSWNLWTWQSKDVHTKKPHVHTLKAVAVSKSLAGGIWRPEWGYDSDGTNYKPIMSLPECQSGRSSVWWDSHLQALTKTMASRTGLRIQVCHGDGAPSTLKYVGHPHISTEANSEGEVDGKQSLTKSCFMCADHPGGWEMACPWHGSRNADAAEAKRRAFLIWNKRVERLIHWADFAW